MSEKPARSRDTAAHADVLIRRAAMIGAFDPLDLLPPNMPAESAGEMLAYLGRASEEVIERGRLLWRLGDDTRRNVLATLRTVQQADRLIHEVRPADDDIFGRALQNALVGRAFDASAQHPDTADLIYAARSFAIAAPCAQHRAGADPRPVRNAIVARRRVERQQVVLPRRLHGRGAQKAAIENFLNGESIPARFCFRDAATKTEGGALLVTGVGGVGKSALIAAVLRDAYKHKSQMPIVTLDFDRPNLFHADRIEMLREITRQLATAVPALDRPLAKAREKIGKDIPDATGPSARMLQETAALDAIQAALGTLPKRRRKDVVRPAGFGVVLDTFEEVATRGNDDVAHVLSWFTSLAASGLSPLRLVVSGRAAPDMNKAEMARWFAGHIELGGLQPNAGAALLRDNENGPGVFAGQRGLDAARAFRGHPLALKFLIRYAEQHNETELDDLIQEALKSPTFPPEFAQVFLFTRILGRIRDNDVKQLAHPGLVLRRVTPQLIRDVLAGPCGFGNMDETQARNLFGKLKRTAWVVERTDDENVVVHRRDLRRLMLPLMMRPKPGNAEAEQLRDKALAIHRVAGKWYWNQHKQLSTFGQEAIEAFYHRACAGLPFEPQLGPLKILATALGEDLADLPVAVRGIAKVAMGRYTSVSDEELEHLAPDDRRKVLRARDEVALRRGETGKVRRTTKGNKPLIRFTDDSAVTQTTTSPIDVQNVSSTVSRDHLPSTFSEADQLFGNDIHARWIEADFESVVEIGERAFSRLWLEGSHEGFIETRDDPVYLAVWKYLLSLLVAGRWPEVLRGPDAAEHLHRTYQPQRITNEVLLPWTLHNAAVALAWRAVPFDLPPPSDPRPMRAGWEPVPDQLVRARIDTSFGLRTASLGAFLAQALGQGTRNPEIRGNVLQLLTGPILASCAERLEPDLVKRLGPSSEPLLSFSIGRDLSTNDERDLHSAIRKIIQLRTPLGLHESTNFVTILGTASLRLNTENPVEVAPPELQIEPARGRLPELASPIHQALTPLMRDHVSSLTLIEVGDKTPLWPSDLDQHARRSLKEESEERFLATLIDLADQAGLLTRFLDTAASLASGNQTIARVRALVARVDEVFHTAPFTTATGGAPA